MKLRFLFIFILLFTPFCVFGVEKEIVVFAPHFDDAILPLGGFLSQSQNTKTVVTVFGGAPDQNMKTLWDNWGGFASSNEAIDSRKKENESALKGVGATNIVLPFVDGQYRHFISDATTTLEIKKSIVDILNQKTSDHTEVDVYFPSYFGKKITHPDHRIVHDIMLSLLSEKRWPYIKWYMYEDMPYTIIFYKKSKASFLDFLRETYQKLVFKQFEIMLSKKDFDLKKKNAALYVSQQKAFLKSKQSFDDVLEFTARHCVSGPCEKVYEVKEK